ncbi:MAG: EAL domain-containing protein [Rhodoferax sp.]|nr:EAL domain-containing protein [Rhodoferax sp.]
MNGSIVGQKLAGRLVRLSQRNERALDLFASYALPILIGIASLLALLVWPSQYSGSLGRTVDIRVMKGGDRLDDPRAALQQIKGVGPAPHHDTRLSEKPFWVLVPVASIGSTSDLSLEFPSRHAMEISCWDAESLVPLGRANRTDTGGEMRAVRAGFVLDLADSNRGHDVLCQTSAIGPARLSAMVWDRNELNAAAQDFHRKSGLLDGGILVLAVFVLITALVNREPLYLLFAAWLVVNLRMAALSSGWDTQWLGYVVPYDWLVQGRLVTITLYYILTLTLFTTLFREDLQRIGYRWLVRGAQWTCFPLLVLALSLPFASFLPIIWTATGASIAVLAFLMVRILQLTRSRVAILYTAAIAVTLVASFYEVIAAAMGIKGLIGAINSVTAALSSSMLTALAFAEQMRQEHVQRMEVQAELEHTFEAMPIGMFTLDLEGRFLSANPALRDMLGEDVLTDGRNHWHQYFEAGAWSQLHRMVHDRRDAGESADDSASRSGFSASQLPDLGGANKAQPLQRELEVRGRKQANQTQGKRFLVKATLARDKIEGSLQDVTEKSIATENLYFLANHDSLTKVLNRRGVERMLDEAIRRLEPGGSMALAYLDLDRFKLINDLFGHAVGDEVLQQVCKRVTDMLPRDIQFGRVGGDEFVIAFPNTPVAMAAHMCQGIVDNIGTRPYRVGGKAFYVRGSIGLIEVGHGMALKDAISTADRACRQAKAANSDGLVVYERYAVAFQQHEAELKLIAQLSTSTATEGLYLEMQPIMSLSAPHESLNFEVLLRMRDHEGKNIPTDRLIAAGEASGRMSVIDRWVLSTTLAWLDQHRDELKQTRFVCMNLSGASLNDEKFLQDVYALLEKNRHIASQICLEITESVALSDIENTRRFVNRVRRIGARVALDDFGAGYTSFSYLKEFTADLLKIDGSFIVNMNQHPANIAIVEAIVNLARNLGMKVIAEWAEDQATVQTLTEIGVDYVQGFVVARSQHPDRLLEASSSASFVKDEDLAQMLAQVGRTDGVVKQVDLFADVGAGKLH